MIIDESEVAVKKFKMFADKATTELQLIDLCKKYLAHKGLDVDALHNTATKALLEQAMEPPRIEKIYVGMSDLIEAQSQYTIDDHLVRSIQDDFQMQALARREIAQKLMNVVVQSDAIQFHEFKDYARAQLVVRGKLIVYKDPRYVKKR